MAGRPTRQFSRMALPSVVLVIAALLVVISFAEPFAQRVRLPSSVILALVGLVIGIASGLFGRTADPEDAGLVALMGDLPVSSAVFLYIFLPPLLFHGALNIDARDMLRDAVPIFVLAVIAVVVTTLAVGLILSSFAGMPLLACLLVGSVVATTDPSAVLAIFRDLGAPQRLARLVEGESLSNDAVAITLFVIFLELLTASHPVEPSAAIVQFIMAPIGGAAIGLGRWVAARRHLWEGRREPPGSGLADAGASLSRLHHRRALAFLGPDRRRRGRAGALRPRTGAYFAILVALPAAGLGPARLLGDIVRLRARSDPRAAPALRLQRLGFRALRRVDA